MARAPADPLMRSQLVRLALAAVRAAGGDARAVARKHGLNDDAETAPEVVMPLSAMHALFEDAERGAGDPFLGVHIAERFERGTFGVLEFAARSAPTIREALRRIVRYIVLLNELVEVGFDETAAIVEQRIPGRPLCVGRHANEFFVAMIVVCSRALTDEPVVPRRVWLAHPQPSDLSELTRVLGTERIVFGAEANGVELDARVLDARLATADPALLALLDRQAQETLSSRASPSRFLGQVRAGVRSALRGGAPSLETLALSMRMSPRTLQRRLADEGTTFHALVEGVREELARIYVEDRARPLGEIAFLLGYSELSPFLRAFKRWTGTTPSAVRG